MNAINVACHPRGEAVVDIVDSSAVIDRHRFMHLSGTKARPYVDIEVRRASDRCRIETWRNRGKLGTRSFIVVVMIFDGCARHHRK